MSDNTNLRRKWSATKSHLSVFAVRHKKASLSVGCIVLLSPLLIMIASAWWISSYNKYILDGADSAAVAAKHIRVGVVMGAGVAPNGKPYKELQARLDSAADALQKKEIEKLILTGDNSTQKYDEPAAMQRYLNEVKHIPKEKLQVDDAGRDTYASCERASKIFGLRQTIIFSAGTHLPRAIFICRHFGIEAYGIASGVEANNAFRRELLARPKAMIDVYLWHESVILGEQIKI